MTCRDEILSAFRRLILKHHRDVFQLNDIVREVQAATKRYTESTIRTHVASKMCKQAPDHHRTVYPDLDRVGRSLYRLRSG